MTRWIDPPQTTIPDFLCDLPPLVACMLVRRGLTTPEAVAAFLDPNQYTQAPAWELPGLEAAVERIERAVRHGESICVWGDFDVDGQTSTTLLVQALQALSADVSYHIPIRAEESHGVNLPHLTQIIEGGAQLILTCDTGITAHQAVEYARSRSVDFVISDHHDLPPELPQAAAVVNPKLLPADHPLATLPGVGVAYKLAEALLSDGGQRIEDRQPSTVSGLSPNDLLDLVALGIVADLAILQGDTRALLQRGLVALRQTQRLGLQTMFELARIDPQHLNEEHISFTLAPRLNALGRLGDANPAVELLTTRDPVRARVLVTQLERLNAQRRLLTNQVYQAAEAQLRAEPELLEQPVLVLGHPSWPGGVIGIAASHLVERHHRPTILLSTSEGEPARGSARSIEGLNITAAISQQSELLLNYGGHPMAAGLSLPTERLPEFRRALGRTVAHMLGGALPETTLQIDAWLSLSDLNLELAESLERLAPFGPGNPSLTFATRNLAIKSLAAMGPAQEHLRLSVEDESGQVQTVVWWNGAGEELPEYRFDLAYTLRTSDFRGERQVQLTWADFRPLEAVQVEDKQARLEIIDYRGSDDPRQILGHLKAEALKRSNVPIQIWAEAEQKKEVSGRRRDELEPAQALVIWSTPPGRSELRAALSRVRPEQIYLFGINPSYDNPQAFLERLAGLTKYALNQRGGQAGLSELVSACAQREITVRLGLEWLAAGGHLSLQVEADALHLRSGDQQKNPYVQGELLTAIQGLLREAAAYRAHFAKAKDPKGLLDLQGL
jgi:single-stranded-DNA-specific exonuclease